MNEQKPALSIEEQRMKLKTCLAHLDRAYDALIGDNSPHAMQTRVWITTASLWAEDALNIITPPDDPE